MEKNTKWAIVLGTIVLVGWVAMQYKYGAKPNQQRNQAAAPAVTEQTAVSDSGNVSEKEGETSASVSVLKAASDYQEMEFTFVNPVKKSGDDAEEVSENDNRLFRATFTNKGGDISAFELTQHKDKDRKAEDGSFLGVEMVNNDSADEDKRAFSVAVNNSYVADTFGITCTKAFAANVEGWKESIPDGINLVDDTDNVYVTFNQTFNMGDKKKEFSLAKTYTFLPEEYLFRLDVNFTGNVPASYKIRNSSQIGPKLDPKDRYEYRRVIYYNADDKDEDANFSEKETKYLDESYDWVGVAGKYFEIITVPVNCVSADGKANWSSDTNEKIVSFKQNKAGDKVSNNIEIESHKSSDTYMIYIGPRTEDVLTRYNASNKNGWGISTRLDYSMPSSGFLSWLQTLLRWILEFFHWIIPNWGVAIILTTLLLKVCLFPLTKKSLMGTKKMQTLQPQMEAIKAKYKDNPQRQQQETAKLYKESGYNPISGCLPLILQFLVLWSMYQLFNNYFEFRGSSFIPGWIDDLSRGDSVHEFATDHFFIGRDLRVLPVIYLISQLLYGVITQNGGTATGSTGMNMKIMMYGMPIMFFFIFYTAPSGLLLYWTVSNLFQLFQQLLVNRMMKDGKLDDKKTLKIANGKNKRK